MTLEFQSASSTGRSDPARADIACFIGFVACRGDVVSRRSRFERALRDLGMIGPPLPAAARILPDLPVPFGESSKAFHRWLASQGWQHDPAATHSPVAPEELFRRSATAFLGAALVDWWVEFAWLQPFSGRAAADLLEMRDIPVPIDNWDAFDALFAWNQRPLGDGRIADTTLGAAVRRFFAQGGRKCYVIRLGDPWPVFTDAANRRLGLRLLECVPASVAVDRSTWAGLGHLFGLPDASFLCVPDLPELFAADVPVTPAKPDADTEERFIECGTRVDTIAPRNLRTLPAPRCDSKGFEEWAAFVSRTGEFLRRHCREVQFIAAVPLALDRSEQWQRTAAIQSAFVQLSYPWINTRAASMLPAGLEPPDAMLTGILAGNALTAGTWRSAARTTTPAVQAVEPVLSVSELNKELPYDSSNGPRRSARTLRERISVFGPTPTGFQLLSDVTTDDDEAYRPANVNRLVSAIVRAARILGETTVFMNNGESVWRRLRSSLEQLLLGLYGEGALAGVSAKDAFSVRCDRSTMTQADLDAGRVIARVEFTASSPIEKILVILAMDEGGQVSLVEAVAA